MQRLAASSLRQRPGNVASLASSCWRWMAITPDTGADTHDDFKPKYKQAAAAPEDVGAQIRQDVADNKVLVYMKGTPAEPMCGFSRMACAILDAYGVKYGSRNVLSDPLLRDGIKEFTSWPTIPQVFVDGEFVGGCDILLGMHQNGELAALFAKVGAGDSQAPAQAQAQPPPSS